MPDWRREAQRRLENTKFPAGDRDEISRELAGYLEDLCSDALSRGADESSATGRAFAELHHDARLGPHLYRARKENNVHLNDRTKHFWLPGMATLLASAAYLAILQIAGFQAEFRPLWLHGGAATANSIYLPLAIYWPWLFALPFLGAGGTYWSRRAGAGLAAQGTVGFFSVLVFLATFLIVLVFLFLNYLVGGDAAPKTLLPEFAGAVVSWVVIPGMALLLGVLPFLRGSATRRIA
jgi:hypothetical protein